jgi:hypothetical protein
VPGQPTSYSASTMLNNGYVIVEGTTARSSHDEGTRRPQTPGSRSRLHRWFGRRTFWTPALTVCLLVNPINRLAAADPSIYRQRFVPEQKTERPLTPPKRLNNYVYHDLPIKLSRDPDPDLDLRPRRLPHQSKLHHAARITHHVEKTENRAGKTSTRRVMTNTYTGIMER